jgi:hypothetical protein
LILHSDKTVIFLLRLFFFIIGGSGLIVSLLLGNSCPLCEPSQGCKSVDVAQSTGFRSFISYDIELDEFDDTSSGFVPGLFEPTSEFFFLKAESGRFSAADRLFFACSWPPVCSRPPPTINA